MPVYEFECRKCGQVFEVVMSMAEAAVQTVACPMCSSDDIEKVYSPFSAVTSKKS